MSINNKNKPCVDSGLCRCCGNTKKCRLLNVEYEWMGQKEVYSDMFVDCFGLMLSHLEADPGDRLICATCVTRLREACLFKRQVLQCEQKLLQAEILVDTDSDKIKVEQEVKQETDDDPDHQNIEGDADLVTSKNKLQIESVSVIEQKKQNKSVHDKVLVKEIKAAEHLRAKRELLLRIKKMKEKLREMQRVGKPYPPETNKLVVRKYEDREMNAIRNAITIVENSYACPFYNSYSNYHCLYCNEKFIDPKELRDHTITHDPSGYKKIIKKKKVLQIDIFRIDCRLCPKSIDNYDLFKSHITSVHGMKFYDNVENEFLKFRLKVGMLNCIECDAPFGYFHALKRHMAEHFGTHICDVCGAHYFDQPTLTMHKRFHERLKSEKYPCKLCDRVFNYKYGLKYHIMRMHTRTMVFPCHKCDEKLQTEAKRYRHMIAVHGEQKPFPCDSCDHVFDNKRSLTAHLRRLHLKVLKHECNICKKKFFQPSVLRNHMATHTGEKKYRCENCGKGYSKMRSLRSHLKSHDSEKM